MAGKLVNDTFVAEPEVLLQLGMNGYMHLGVVRSVEVTNSFFLRDTFMNSGVSMLKLGMARNLFGQLRSITGLYHCLVLGPGLGSSKNLDCLFFWTTSIAPLCSKS